MSESEKPYEGYAIVELMGHRRLGGRVCQAEQYGVAMLRVDVPGDDGEIIATTFAGGSSIYALTPCSEEAARAVAKSNRVEPVARWELPALAAPSGAEDHRLACDGCGVLLWVGRRVAKSVCDDCAGPANVADEDEQPDF